MPDYFPAALSQRVKVLDQSSCRRVLSPRAGLDFSSNDYLGLSDDGEFKKLTAHLPEDLPRGAAGSRLLRGQIPFFDQVETQLAEFCGREAALVFPSGYQANVGVLSALLRPGDTVFSDQLNHASLIDGIRLSGAHKRVYPHRNLEALRELLAQSRQNDADGFRLIVTESIFSMDGDQAPLVELADLAEEFQAHLLVDEAHSTGLWGDFKMNRGGGLIQSLGLQSRVLATLHPAGKSMGVSGAWVSGDSALKDYLVNCARSFIFSTAPSPVLFYLLEKSVQYWQKVGVERANEVLQKSKTLQSKLKAKIGQLVDIPDVRGPILPIVFGDNEKCLRLSQSLRDQGLDVRAIRPPTVPEGTSRLRVSVNWNQSEENLELFVNILGQICFRHNLEK